MEIFVNVGKSHPTHVNALIIALEEKDEYEHASIEQKQYLVIDNLNERFYFEQELRTNRELSHYLVLNISKDVDSALKMIRNQIFTRSNSGKVQWSLVDFDTFEPMVRVLEAGAEKYDRSNWKKGDLNKQEQLELWESLFRHVKDIQKGLESGDPIDIYDKDLGINHIGNAMCNLMFLSYHTIGKGKQQIFKPN